MRGLSLLILLTGIGWSSCTQSGDGSCAEENCSADFVMITANITDSIGNPFYPDSTVTITENGKRLHTQNSPTFPSTSQYTIIDDSHMNSLAKFFVSTVYCKVYKDDSLIHTEPYAVSANCCHVFKQSGSATIVVHP